MSHHAKQLHVSHSRNVLSAVQEWSWSRFQAFAANEEHLSQVCDRSLHVDAANGKVVGEEAQRGRQTDSGVKGRGDSLLVGLWLRNPWFEDWKSHGAAFLEQSWTQSWCESWKASPHKLICSVQCKVALITFFSTCKLPVLLLVYKLIHV